ncbi:MAG: hypothetical protein RIM99_06465 [Cyclobacteriaceae bacterium]
MKEWKDRKDDRAYTVDIFFQYNPCFGEELLEELSANLVEALEGMCEIDLDATDITITAGEHPETITFYGEMQIDMTCEQTYRQARDLIEAVIPDKVMENLGNWDIMPDPENPDDYVSNR